jgi:hypothetical protein
MYVKPFDNVGGQLDINIAVSIDLGDQIGSLGRDQD